MVRSTAKRFTVYDMMEEKGVFDANTANVYARDPATGASTFKRQEYPKMYYHPKGETEVVKPGLVGKSAMHLEPVLLNEHREIINRMVHSAEEEAEAVAEGWHDHPAKALAASGKKAPAVVPAGLQSSYDVAEAKLSAERQRAKDLEDEIAKLRAALAEQNDEQKLHNDKIQNKK